MNMGRVYSNSNHLGAVQILECRPAPMDLLRWGPPEVEGGGGSFVRLDVAFPLEARVPKGEGDLTRFVRWDPRAGIIGGRNLEQLPKVGVWPIQQLVSYPGPDRDDPVSHILVINNQVSVRVALVGPNCSTEFRPPNCLAARHGARCRLPACASGVSDLPTHCPGRATKVRVSKVAGRAVRPKGGG